MPTNATKSMIYDEKTRDGGGNRVESVSIEDTKENPIGRARADGVFQKDRG